jgi:hypothetical protein
MDNLGPIIVALLGGGLITGIVGIVGFFVNWRSKRQELASQQETEAYRAQQDALQKYLDEMARLMDKLSSSGPEFEQARRVAQAWTMAILTGTGPSFKRELITLVSELGLITTPNPILELRNAPMDRANLSEHTLRDVSLQGVDLRRANLHGADLEGSNLNLADLRGADLRVCLVRFILTSPAASASGGSWPPR